MILVNLAKFSKLLWSPFFLNTDFYGKHNLINSSCQDCVLAIGRRILTFECSAAPVN